MDVVVIGAGIVGLAVAARLAGEGRVVTLLERRSAPAQETTARNSEVIHAGIYYAPGSLKARLCVEGRGLLYDRCREWRIPHRRVGKWIVATDDREAEVLEALHARASENGVAELEWADAARVRAAEPDVVCRAALWSASTGIVDAASLASSYEAEARRHGAQLVTACNVIALEPRAAGWRVTARTGSGEAETLDATAVVNACGLAADRVAALAGIDLDGARYRLNACKGDYFQLAPSAPLRFAHLVYPVPSGGGLGVHTSFDLTGRVRFGPDAQYLDGPADAAPLQVDPAKAVSFGAAIRRYVPTLRDDWITPDFAGIRPKLSRDGEPVRDFVIQEESERGCPGLVNCIGIESPGLTAAGAIARYVAGLLRSL